MNRCIVSLLLASCVLGRTVLAAPPMFPGQERPSPPPRAVPVAPSPEQSPADAAAAASVGSRVRVDENYVLRSGDRVSLSIAEDRKAPTELIVQASGEIEAPYVGRFPAAGKTCRALSADLKAALERSFYKRATVNVGLNQAASMPLQNSSNIRVYMTGAVRSQGAREFAPDGNITVSKAILISGGFGEFANQKKVQLIRRLPNGKTQITTVNVYDLLQGKAGPDPLLEAEDMIRVPEKLINF